MKYELAKELKDAGFVQNWDDMNDGEDMIRLSQHKEYGESAYIPSLSELISACGDSFTGLFRAEPINDLRWVARADLSKKDYRISPAKTPEIAVARLYIALNKDE